MQSPDNVEDVLRRAETPLMWVGAFTVASLALWLLYRLLSGIRIWVLGNGGLLSPKLGKWAGEFTASFIMKCKSCLGGVLLKSRKKRDLHSTW